MVEQATSLPFFFRELSWSGRFLVSNALGNYTILRAREQLEAIVAGEFHRLPAALVEELFAKSFIAEPGEEALRASLLASGLTTSMARALSRPGLFIVVPTLRCDHDCRYCQVSRAPLQAHGYDAVREHIPAILKHIAVIAGRTAKIEFQGGEPLLAFAFIREFVRQADVVLAGRRVSYVICSALGPLDDEIVEWARKHDVVFSISLDGDSHVHNGNRPSRYFDAYRGTVQKISRLQQLLGTDRVACVATVTRSALADPGQLVDTYFDQNLDSLFVRPLAPYGFATHLKRTLGYSAGEYAGFFARVLERVVERNSERMFVEESTFLRLRRIFDPGFSGSVDMQSPAGVLLGALVFNYDGRVFGSDEARMLWESTKAAELVLGTVADDARVIAGNDSAASLLADTFTCTMPGCEECAYQPFCGADPLHHLSTQGDSVGDKALSFYCQLQTALFDQLFELLEDSRYRRVFDSWLRHR